MSMFAGNYNEQRLNEVIEITESIDDMLHIINDLRYTEGTLCPCKAYERLH